MFPVALANIFQDNFVQEGDSIEDLLKLYDKPLSNEVYEKYKKDLVSNLVILRANNIVSTNICCSKTYLDDGRLKTGGLECSRWVFGHTSDLPFGDWRFAPPESTFDPYTWSRGEYTMKYDIWSLGALLYFLRYKNVVRNPLLLKYRPSQPEDYLYIRDVDTGLDPDLKTLLELNPKDRVELDDFFHVSPKRGYCVLNQEKLTNIALSQLISSNIDSDMSYMIEMIYLDYVYGIGNVIFDIDLLNSISNMVELLFTGIGDLEEGLDTLETIKFRIFP